MGKQDLRAKSIAELRSLAKKAGIAAKRGWGKEDFIKALSKVRAKTKAPRKPAGKKAALKKTAGKPPKKAQKKAASKVQQKGRKASRATVGAGKRSAKKVTPKAARVKTPKPAKPAKAVKVTAVKTGVKPVSNPLEQLTLVELRALAKKEGIILTGLRKKADIVAAVDRARAAKEKVKPHPRKAKKIAAPKAVRKGGKAVSEEVRAEPRKTAERVAGPMPLRKGAVEKIVEAARTAGTAPEPVQTEAQAAEEPPRRTTLIEFDSDRVMSMSVTPRRLYVYWELSEDTLARHRGSLNVKIMDMKTGAFFYTPISERIGEQFFTVNPDMDYAVEIGVINYNGDFINLAQAMPAEESEVPSAEPEPSEERGLPEEFFGTPDTVSSY